MRTASGPSATRASARSRPIRRYVVSRMAGGPINAPRLGYQVLPVSHPRGRRQAEPESNQVCMPIPQTRPADDRSVADRDYPMNCSSGVTLSGGTQCGIPQIRDSDRKSKRAEPAVKRSVGLAAREHNHDRANVLAASAGPGLKMLRRRHAIHRRSNGGRKVGSRSSAQAEQHVATIPATVGRARGGDDRATRSNEQRNRHQPQPNCWPRWQDVDNSCTDVVPLLGPTLLCCRPTAGRWNVTFGRS